MRVTKRVEEYIRNKVREAYETKYVNAEEYEETQKKIRAYNDYVEEELDKLCSRLIGDARTKFGLAEDRVTINKETRYGYLRPDIDYRNSPVFQEHDEQKRKIRELEFAKEEDIFIRLELGATKDDLDKILSGLSEEI